MKNLIFIAIFGLTSNFLFSQNPQFAVVRPDGTTFICPTWDSAYNKAIDGDNIYMPGITLTSAITINKKLFIYGAGHHPDSNAATGKTSVSNVPITITAGGSGGSLEGINQIGHNTYLRYIDKKLNGYTIKRCNLGSVTFVYDSYPPADSFTTNILITECILENIDCNQGRDVSCFFSKNIIRDRIYQPTFCTISNNIFLISGATTALYGPLNNCTIENNVFLVNQPLTAGDGCNNNFYNNLKISGPAILNGCPTNTGIEVGTISVPTINDVFISFNPAFTNFPYIDNYHLKSTCPGVNAGTDGTDVGIYGTATPTSEGWVPSNPHIYFKQVSTQTNPSGQLPVQFKVRTNN